MPQWKYVMCVALFVYCGGIVLFALYPYDSVDWSEWVAVVAAAIAAVGLVAYAMPGVQIPFEDYAYLIVGFAGFTTMLLYLVDTADPSLRRTGVALFLGSGAISGYGAFLAQGQRQGP